MEEEKGRVCVTGGTGFLASWLIMKLLQNGYSVHTTIRPDPRPGERDQYEHLLNVSMVHTDDVARAHIFLFEYGEAKGRYICSSDTITIEDMSKFLFANYPEFSIPTIESLSDIQGFRLSSLTSKKLLDSGFEFKYGLKEMFDGAIQSCKAKGYLSFN